MVKLLAPVQERSSKSGRRRDELDAAREKIAAGDTSEADLEGLDADLI